MLSKELCLGCMKQREEGDNCPYCGWKHDSAVEQVYLEPGVILKGQYLMGKMLGHGGFGITYLGIDINLRTKLAVKEYLPDTLAARELNHKTVSVFMGEKKRIFDEGLKRFLDEARVLASFGEYPSIVMIRDYFEENKTGYIVMNYIEGITFQKYLFEKGKKISVEEALKIIAPVMEALKHVHTQGLIHRDISPDNIYITKSGQVKILDFGSAKYSTGEDTQTHTVMLKHGYAPYEQYQKKSRQGAWTDVYALSATLYKAVTGKVPQDALDRREDDKLIPPSKLGIQILPESESALMKGLSIFAKDRFQTMQDMQEALIPNIADVGDLKINIEDVIKKEAEIRIKPKVNKGKNNNNEKIFKGLLILGAFLILFIASIVFWDMYKGSQSKKIVLNGTTTIMPTTVETTVSTTSALTTSIQPTTSESTTIESTTSIEKDPENFTNKFGMKFIYIKPGTFTMGSPKNESGRYDNEKQHKVTLTKGFYIQTTEVTQGQWTAVMGNNPSKFKDCGKNCPVEQVSWDDVQKFIKKLNEKEGTDKYKLPTEAEWEYAARAGSKKAVYTGDMSIIGSNNSKELDPIAWYGGNSCVNYSGGYDCSSWSERQYSCSKCGTHPVAQKEPNAFGLYDMIGNVWEWCQDWYGDYPSGAVTDPTGPKKAAYRVVRGGSWNNSAWYCRSAIRISFSPANRYSDLGFRLACLPGH